MKEYRVTLKNDGSPIDFTFDGGPLFYGENLPNLYAAIGRLSLAWSQMEQHVDALLIHINNKQNSEKLYNEIHPYAFRKKIQMLKRWFNQHPALSELAEHFRLISTKLIELAQHRNHILHGSLHEWDHENQIAVFRTLKFEGDDEFHLKRHTYPLELIDAVGDMTAHTNRYLSDVSHAVFQREMTERLRTP